MSMLHAILSILVGALGGLSARVIFFFFFSVDLLPLSLFSSRRELKFLQYKPLWLCAYWLLLFPCLILQ